MPELVEVEAYRRLALAEALGRKIDGVQTPDDWYLKGGLTRSGVRRALTGRRLVGARRVGKLLLIDTDDGGPTVGLRFGMSGRLVVDGKVGMDRLIYTSTRRSEEWDRFGLRFADGGHMRVNDPRRLGGVLLDPDESRLGVDALDVGQAALARALAGSAAPLKARLMDQSRLAGVGNLIADEVLWRAGLDPARPCRSLSPADLRRLHRHLRSTLVDMLAAGGSHTGRLMVHRRPGGICPADDTPLVRRTVGARTTWSCPRHQL